MVINMEENKKITVEIDAEFLSMLKDACRSVCLLTAALVFKIQRLEKEIQEKK